MNSGSGRIGPTIRCSRVSVHWRITVQQYVQNLLLGAARTKAPLPSDQSLLLHPSANHVGHLTARPTHPLRNTVVTEFGRRFLQYRQHAFPIGHGPFLPMEPLSLGLRSRGLALGKPPVIILNLVCLVFTNQVLGKTTEVGGHRVLRLREAGRKKEAEKFLLGIVDRSRAVVGSVSDFRRSVR